MVEFKLVRSNDVFSGQGLPHAMHKPAGIPNASSKLLETSDKSIPRLERKPATVSSDVVSRFINRTLPGQAEDDTHMPRLSPLESVKYKLITEGMIERPDRTPGKASEVTELRFTRAVPVGHSGTDTQIPIVFPDESNKYDDISLVLMLRPAMAAATDAAPFTRTNCE